MNTDILLIAALAGLANWAFRALPILLVKGEITPKGILAGFLGATGPAAIATLFVASVWPRVVGADGVPLPLIVGSVVTVLVFWPKRSVVAATLAGSFAYGLTFWLTMP